VPIIKDKGNEIEMSFVWLGSELIQRRPFWSFKKAFLHINRDDYVYAFSLIKSINLQKLTELIEELDNIDSIAAKMLKKAALNQIKIIGNSVMDENEMV